MRSHFSLALFFFWASFLAIPFIQMSSGRAAEVLTLDGYLTQVESQNENFQRASRAVKAAELREEEWKLLTSPYLFGGYAMTVDKREPNTPQLQGDRTDNTSASLGIGQRTRFGLDAKLTYNFGKTDVYIPPSPFFPNPSFYTSGPVLELTQSLGKNGFGAETRANQEALAANLQAQKLTESYNQIVLKTQAEGAYWRMAVAREAVRATQDSLDRAVRSRKLMADRTKLELADRADLLQNDAAVASREMELQRARDEERVAARAFNTTRGTEDLEVKEALAPISEDLIRSLAPPARKGLRADVQATAEQARALKASSEVSIQANRPTVDLFATAGLNGRDPEASNSMNESFTVGHPNYTVGVKATVPLEMGIQARVREGYRVQARAQELLVHRKLYETEREWQDLEQKFFEGKNRLTLAMKVENALKAQLEAERNRLRRGRTTVFAVVKFEEDFASAQLGRIRMEAEVLGLYSQMKTFGGAL